MHHTSKLVKQQDSGNNSLKVAQMKIQGCVHYSNIW
jgi:hypothetical protein